MQNWIIGCSTLLLTLFPISWSQRDCSCDISVWGRQFCAASPFARNRQECEAAGCCYSFAIFSPALRCYERDLSRCPQNPSTPLGINYGTCTPATPLQQCGFGLNQLLCESAGCCYIPNYAPSCVLANSGTNTVGQLTSNWGQWTACSSSCSAGTRSRTRQCLAQNPLECNHRGINLAETEICNVGMCNSWGNWIPSPCSVTCGSGTSTYTRSCRGSGFPGSRNCYSVTTSCSLADCTTPTPTRFTIFAIWSQWSTWQICTNPCGPGKQSRTRNCVLDRTVVRPDLCSNNGGMTSIQTEDCNLSLCSIWTDWTPSTSCTETCGSRSTRFVTRRCVDSSQTGTESNLRRRCSSRQVPCILAPCPTADPSQRIQTIPPDNVFTLPSSTASSVRTPTVNPGAAIFTIVWSSTSTAKTPIQVTTEATTTSTVGSTINAGPTLVNTAPPTNTSTVSATPVTGQTDKVSVTSSTTTTPLTSTVNLEEFATTTPPFWESTAPVTPSDPEGGSFEETPVTDSNEIAPSWSPWSTWSLCSTSCGYGIQVRTRICLFNNGTVTESESDCGINAIETSECIDGECATSSPAPTESTASILNTTEVTESTTVISQSPTTDDDIAEWQTWRPWTECSSTCSPGLRTRFRACKRFDSEVEPTECNRVDPGSMFDEDECNTNLCYRWSAWRSTGCSVTCNRGEDEPPGVVLTRRGCLVPETERAGETCYLVSDICNATKPCPVSSTTTQPTMSTTTVTTESSTSSSTTKISTTIQSTEATQSSGDIWTEWTAWSSCSTSCAPGIQTRERECLPNVPQQLCSEGGFMSRTCNQEFCTGWSRWQASPCDRTCGDDGSQLRRRICLSGQSLESMPESCHRVSQPCQSSLPCEGGKVYPKQDILFLVDSSTHVDDCDSIQKETGLSAPLRTPQLTDEIAPTYSRIKKFLTDFVDAWEGISNEGTRVGIQLISGLCNGRTRANLYVEKRYNETHELLKEYIAFMPYLCGDFWLDWAMQCSHSPVMSERYGDRKDVPNIVVAIVSNVPASSLPRESSLRRIVKRLGTKATIFSATATNTTTIAPVSRKRYVEHTQKIACPDGTQCSRFLGSIWDMESKTIANKIRDVLEQESQKS